MAQTTQNASFGPVFLVVGNCSVRRLIVLIIAIKMSYMISICKKTRIIIKKNLRMAQTTRYAIVWARSSRCNILCIHP